MKHRSIAFRTRGGSALAALLPLFFLATLQSPAQESTALVEDLERMVRYLSSDELEGRRTGTRGNLLAAGYIAGEFAALGLEPVGGRYLHDFSFLRGVEIGEKLEGQIVAPPFRTPTTGSPVRTLVPGSEFRPLGFSDNGWFSGDLVFVGYGISAPDDGYDDYEGVDVTGRIALMLRYSPDGDDLHGALTRHGSFVSKAMTAKEKGATGILIVDVPAEGETSGLIPLAMMRGFRNAGIGAATVHPNVFDGIDLGSGATLSEVAREIRAQRSPQSFVMEGWKASFGVDLVYDEVPAPNVLGMIPGIDPDLKEEIIVVGGHFDHLGHGGHGSLHGGRAPEIHNGADDNASGTAAVIALAESWMKRGDNRRTLIFMAFNGEEEGLLGSADLVLNAPFDVEKVAAMINLDMVGRMNENEVVVQGTGTSGAWEEILEDANRKKLTLKGVPDGFGPSDHSSFYAQEIPVLFFFTGLHDDYHRPSDDWDLVNYEGLAKIVGLVDRVIGEIDEGDERPDYVNVPRRSSGTNVRLKVVLGIIPDYGFGGEGLRITGVSEGGAAEKGGLRNGDIIVGLNGKEVNGIEAYMAALQSVEPGDDVEVVVERNGEKIVSTVRPTGR